MAAIDNLPLSFDLPRFSGNTNTWSLQSATAGIEKLFDVELSTALDPLISIDVEGNPPTRFFVSVVALRPDGLVLADADLSDDFLDKANIELSRGNTILWSGKFGTDREGADYEITIPADVGRELQRLWSVRVTPLTIKFSTKIKVDGIGDYTPGLTAKLTKIDGVPLAGTEQYTPGFTATLARVRRIPLAGIDQYTPGLTASITRIEPTDITLPRRLPRYRPTLTATLNVFDKQFVGSIPNYTPGLVATLTQIPKIFVSGITLVDPGLRARLRVVEQPASADHRHFADSMSLVGDLPIYALEITHTDLDTPIRIVADTVNHTVDGDTYQALAFRASVPQIREGEVPTASLEIDNVGQDIMEWIDESNGGRGAQMRILRLVRPHETETASSIVWEMPRMTVGVTAADMQRITVSLVQRTGRVRPAVKARYDPKTVPGLF